MIRLILLACLALGLPGTDCGGDELGQKETIHQLESRLTVGMSRDKIEAIVTEMGLHYVYVPRSMLEATHQGTYKSKPLSGRIQVSLPPDKGLLFKTVGHVLIDLDADERVVNLRIERGDVPR